MMTAAQTLLPQIPCRASRHACQPHGTTAALTRMSMTTHRPVTAACASPCAAWRPAAPGPVPAQMTRAARMAMTTRCQRSTAPRAQSRRWRKAACAVLDDVWPAVHGAPWIRLVPRAVSNRCPCSPAQCSHCCWQMACPQHLAQGRCLPHHALRRAALPTGLPMTAVA